MSRPSRYTDSPVIKVRDLRKTFDGTNFVLRGVDLDIELGETLVIMGGSGCGKSTLLRHMIRDLTPSGGTIEMFGQEISSLTEREMDEVRKRFGIAFQYSALYNSMTVAENVSLPITEHFPELAPETVEIMVKMKLDQVGMRDFGHLKPGELSGGMRKRVAFARAVALDPEILFYDEPTAGLDPITSTVVDNLITDFSKMLGITSVVVTHEMESAFKVADRIVMLHEGRVVAQGPVDEFRNSDNPLVRQFVNGELEGPIATRPSSTDLGEDLLGQAGG